MNLRMMSAAALCLNLAGAAWGEEAFEVSSRLPTTRATRDAVAAIKDVVRAQKEMLGLVESLETAYGRGSAPNPERAKLWSQLEGKLRELEERGHASSGRLTKLSEVMIREGARGSEESLTAITASRAKLRVTSRPLLEQRQGLARLRLLFGSQADPELDSEYRAMAESNRLLEQMEPALEKAKAGAAQEETDARRAAGEVASMAAAQSVFTTLVAAARGVARSRALREEGLAAKCAMAAAMGHDRCKEGKADLKRLIQDLNRPEAFERIMNLGGEGGRQAEESSPEPESSGGEDITAWRPL